MKKIIAMLLALVMLLSLAACAGTAKTDTAAPADDTSKTDTTDTAAEPADTTEPAERSADIVPRILKITSPASLYRHASVLWSFPVMQASVVSMLALTDRALCSAVRVTRTGSRIPACTMYVNRSAPAS